MLYFKIELFCLKQTLQLRFTTVGRNCESRFLTPPQQAEAPEASTTVIEGWQQQGVEVQRLHQEPEKISHYTVVTKDHRGFTGKLDIKKEKEKQRDMEWIVWSNEENRRTGRKYLMRVIHNQENVPKGMSYTTQNSLGFNIIILQLRGCSGRCRHLRTEQHPLWTLPQLLGWMWWTAGCEWSFWHNAASYGKIR